MFDSEDWFERIYRAADGKVIRLRDSPYNHKRLYHHLSWDYHTAAI